MIVHNETWANIPLLHIATPFMKKDAPIVLFLHGFTSAKEHNLHYAYNLVRQGIRVILPDALYHGDRSENLNEAELNMAFWQIIFQNIKEVDILRNEIVERGFTGKMALAGTSMGGISTAGCVMQYDWIDAAAILMGAVSYPRLFAWQMAGFEKAGVQLNIAADQMALLEEGLAQYDAFTESGVTRFERLPIIFWHGALDPTVPFEMSNLFYEEQSALGKLTNVEYVVDTRAVHKVSRAGVLKVCDYLAHHLA